MLIETRSRLDPEVTALVIAQQRESGGAAVDDADYLVAVVDGRAVACAALHELPGGAAELGHMYVRPAFRGRGISRELIMAIGLIGEAPVV